MDSFSDKALEKNYFFSNRDLTKLFIPLIIEQGLEFWLVLLPQSWFQGLVKQRCQVYPWLNS